MVIMNFLFVFAAFVAMMHSVQSVSEEVLCENWEEDDNTTEANGMSASTLIERANRHIGERQDSPLVIYGDVAVTSGLSNADPCTACRCKWPKSSDGMVYVPYLISNQFSRREICTIKQSLKSFTKSTCIRFVPWNKKIRNYINIVSREGCWSFVGRVGTGRQELSLQRHGCVHKSVIQHEMLHALGFDHEHQRSDRDKHVRILKNNIQKGHEGNFKKIQTNNLRTRYSYASVMQYGRTAFSKNGKPTIIPIPNINAVIGQATQMSCDDILRVNRLYKCGWSSGSTKVTGI